MDIASATSEQRTESADYISEINTTWITLLLEIRKDVKRMYKNFDHFEKPYETDQRIKIICIKIRIAK